MSKKRHGHYCRICEQYKANEKFSGRGHAAHICKACSKRGNKPPPIKDVPLAFVDDDIFDFDNDYNGGDYSHVYDGYFGGFLFDDGATEETPKPKKKRKPNKEKLLRSEQKKQAKALLLKLLVNGDVPIKEITEAATKAGIPHEALRRAKGSLAVISVGGCWHLPNHRKPVEDKKTDVQ